MQVSAQELRDTAGVFDGLADAIGRLPVIDATGGGLGTLGSFLQGSNTAAELDKIEPARTKAIGVLRGRYQEFANLLRESADAYHDTDTDAATRFDALGDFNSSLG
ncbi:type VII secretion target [Nocardia sp. NPDC059240]|uniref:type VII secretion target n=1 Tax=Nocardia sp. NPDC059240 TaxID=3346786 RepID=UPI0036BD7C95